MFQVHHPKWLVAEESVYACGCTSHRGENGLVGFRGNERTGEFTSDGRSHGALGLLALDDYSCFPRS